MNYKSEFSERIQINWSMGIWIYNLLTGVKPSFDMGNYFRGFSELCSYAPYIKLFSRHNLDGWTMWGLDPK